MARQKATAKAGRRMHSSGAQALEAAQAQQAGTKYEWHFGRVTRLARDHGFLEGEDGKEVYFHRHAVLQGFDRLVVGNRVRYAEERGDKGPQASTVDILRSGYRASAGG